VTRQYIYVVVRDGGVLSTSLVVSSSLLTNGTTNGWYDDGCKKLGKWVLEYQQSFFCWFVIEGVRPRQDRAGAEPIWGLTSLVTEVIVYQKGKGRDLDLDISIFLVGHLWDGGASEGKIKCHKVF